MAASVPPRTPTSAAGPFSAVRTGGLPALPQDEERKAARTAEPLGSMAASSAARRLEIVTKEGRGRVRPAPVVPVHGAWHGAWCWEGFQEYLAERGYTSLAVSLRGHGRSEGRERLRWTRAAEFVDDVAEVVAALPRPPVLIGHSAGGYIVQRVLESCPVGAAVLLASVPSRGALRPITRIYRRHPLKAARANLTLENFHLIDEPQIARRSAFLDGFSLHAGVRIHGRDCEGLERLCRYAVRPPFSLHRLSRAEDGRLVYRRRRPRLPRLRRPAEAHRLHRRGEGRPADPRPPRPRLAGTARRQGPVAARALRPRA